MSDNKHTPGPWWSDDDDGEIIRLMANPSGKPGGHRHVGSLYGTWADAKANARRIVACVNACAGIPTERLESNQSVIGALGEYIDQIIKQRDELLAASESIIARFMPSRDNYIFSKRAALDKLQAAVASVKGEAK